MDLQFYMRDQYRMIPDCDVTGNVTSSSAITIAEPPHLNNASVHPSAGGPRIPAADGGQPQQNRPRSRAVQTSPPGPGMGMVSAAVLSLGVYNLTRPNSAPKSAAIPVVTPATSHLTAQPPRRATSTAHRPPLPTQPASQKSAIPNSALASHRAQRPGRVNATERIPPVAVRADRPQLALAPIHAPQRRAASQRLAAASHLTTAPGTTLPAATRHFDPFCSPFIPPDTPFRLRHGIVRAKDLPADWPPVPPRGRARAEASRQGGGRSVN
ncbi:hypothetical protein FN846DRAFT_893235 [Sphaerosporella brunnea]|uniref:Uncharacterized protein n=1 Tax=Sphaerosporella brunnea TaxID=1250544 RepID=A0A5J5ELH0_9PEZI|nr:hypothetical protein FN846DRAFT_893235 [Sphaerosporella brunnea]